MKGVILAAGKGSRLYPVTYEIPKPLLPLANRPTLFYAFDRLKEMGIQEICVVVGENEPQMREALGDGSAQGVQLSYVKQTEPKGLAHALTFAKDFVGDEPFVMYLGDAIYGSDFKVHADRFLTSGCANLNIVKPVEDPSRFGVANVEGDRIVRLVEKPAQPESNLAMAGLYFFRPAIWQAIEGLQPSARGEYEITDAIQRLVDLGETVLAGVYDSEWFDTGTLDSFLETSAYLIKDGQKVDPQASVQGEVGQKVVIGEGASVECRSISDSVVLPGAKVRVNGDIRHALIGGVCDSDTPVENSILFEKQGEPAL
jgi:glucose-1-phosphate thymidylyltransferase